MFNVGAIVGEMVLKDRFTGELKKSLSQSELATNKLKMQLAAVSAAAVAMGAAMLAAAKATANYRDETTKAARAAGTSVEEFSKLRHAAELSGIGVGELTNAMAKLASPRTVTRLEELGISLKKMDGTAKSNSEIFTELAERVQKAGTQTEKTRIAVTAFGTEGARLVSMLDNGAEGLEKLKQEAVDLGIAFDEEAGKNAELFNDNLDRLGKSIQGVRDSIGQAIIDFVNSTGVVEALTDAIASVSRWFNNLDQSTKDILVALGAAVVALGALIGAFLVIQAIGPAVGAAVTAAFGPIGLAIAAVVGEIAILIGIVVLLVKNWERFGAAVAPIERVFVKLKNVFSDLWDSIKEALPVVKDLFSGESGKGFIDYVLDGLLAIIKVVASVIIVVEQLIEVIPKLFTQIGDYLKSLWIEMRLEMIAFKNDSERQMLDFTKTVRQAQGDEISALVENTGSSIKLELKKIWDVDLGPPRQAGEDSGEEYSQGAEDALTGPGGPGDKVRSIWEQIGDDGITQTAFTKLTSAMDGVFSKLEKKAEEVGREINDKFRDMVSGYMDSMKALAEAAVAKIQRTSAILDTISQIYLDNLQKNYDAEVRAVEDAENAKIRAVQDASIQRQALIDEEFRKRKEAADLEFQALVERERIEYEMKLQKLQQESADQEQARYATAVMEEDWNAYVEMLRQKHNEQLIQSENQKSAAIKTEEQTTASTVAQIQEESAAKKEDLNKKKEEAEKQHTKKMAMIQYALDLYAYQVQKHQAIAAAGMQLGSSIMAAIEGGIKLAATFPPFTIPLGIAFATTMTALAAGQYASAVSIISSQKPLPPPSLFAEDGGQIMGPRHSNGGVNVNAEGGELFLSRDLTQRVDRMVTRDEQRSQGPMVAFAAGSIIVYGNMDSGMVDQLAESVAVRIQQRRY